MIQVPLSRDSLGIPKEVVSAVLKQLLLVVAIISSCNTNVVVIMINM